MNPIKKFKENFLWALAATSALFLLFFRGRWALSPGIYDDQCYLEWLHKFLLLPYPKCYSTSHLPGVAIQWIPAGLLAKLLAQVSSIPFSHWLHPLVGLETFATWGVSLILLQKIFFKISLTFSESKKMALLFLLNLPALEFLTQFNFTTVGAEIALSSLLLYFILSERWLLALVSAALLNLTRINDPMAFLLIGGALLDLIQANKLLLSKKMKVALISSLAVLAIAALAFTLYVGLVTGYNGVFIYHLLPRLHPYRWWRCLFMGGWGLFWTAPGGILAFVISCFYWRKLSWLARAGLLWVFSEIVLIVVLNELRSDYTNPPWRYIIGSLIGMIPALTEITKKLSQTLKKVFYFLSGFLAIWQVYLAFVTHSFTILRYWKIARWVDDWSLMHYVYLLRDPLDLIKMLYAAPLGFTLFSWGKHWPFFQKYHAYSKYAVEGPSLYLLTLSTILALLILIPYLLNKLPRKPTEML